MMLRPFFTFYGGKWRAAPRYPKPLHDEIIEPFAGSAGYALRHPERKVSLCDLDENIVMTWDYLIRVSEAEILALPDLVAGETVDDLDVCEEAKKLIGWWLNKGASSPCKRPSAWMRSMIRPHQFWGPRIRQRIASQLRFIRHWTITQASYEEIENRSATWFIDPPYEEKGTYYRHGSGAIDFEHLACWCQERQGQVMVCEQEGASWLPFKPWAEIKANESKTGGKRSREVLWMKEAA